MGGSASRERQDCADREYKETQPSDVKRRAHHRAPSVVRNLTTPELGNVFPRYLQVNGGKSNLNDFRLPSASNVEWSAIGPHWLLSTPGVTMLIRAPVMDTNSPFCKLAFDTPFPIETSFVVVDHGDEVKHAVMSPQPQIVTAVERRVGR